MSVTIIAVWDFKGQSVTVVAQAYVVWIEVVYTVDVVYCVAEVEVAFSTYVELAVGRTLDEDACVGATVGDVGMGDVSAAAVVDGADVGASVAVGAAGAS